MRLAALGGTPAFAQQIPIARPPTPPFERVVARLAKSYEDGVLTNGPLTRELELLAADRIGVRHVVAVSSCTAGLMLVIRALDPGGPVVVPSFTFSATAHAVAWNGLEPRFAECDRRSFQIDCVDAEGRLDDAAAVIATHVFGAPCAPETVEGIARARGIPVVFDAAHAFGAKHDGRAIGGFGDAEVFSLSPTKPLTAGEGGLVATAHDDIAETVRIGRDYGNPGDYDTRFAGLNARLSELHAALALESLSELDEHLAVRRALARRYAEEIDRIPGLRVQQVADGDASTWKDLTLAVDPEYGLTRDALVATLQLEGVDTRRYFDPPVHRQRAYAALAPADLPVTDAVAESVVSLPLYRDIEVDTVDRIAALLASIHAHADEIRVRVGS